MSRRRSAKRREINGDVKFGSQLVAKLANCMTKHGAKDVALSAIYKAFDKIALQVSDKDPLTMLKGAISKIRPLVEVRSVRVGGSNYQVPIEVRDIRSLTLAIKWLIEAARARSGHSIEEKLSAEIIDACNERGGAYQKRINCHKTADANRAFAHFGVAFRKKKKA